MATWRNMTSSDLNGVLRIANETHAALPESPSVFQERLRLFPEGCLVLAEGDGDVCGYVVSHPIRRGQPPALNTLLHEIPRDADQYYIHDLVILPEFRGRGLAAEGVRRLLALAGRYPTTCLISVYGSAPFWARFGFVPEPVDEALQEKLRGYGADAVYLSRRNGEGD
ncbi:hypothetical protein VTK56DRAFT_4828 [Thermocarpiscus australiensis]